MGGGLLQLAAIGVQDIYLVGNPQTTFFKVVYRRHTNFSTEPIPQFFDSKPDFGKRVTVTIGRNGDLIGTTYLVVDLPVIPPFIDPESKTIDERKRFAWTKKIGFALISRVDVEVGGQLIDRHYGDWMNIWYELTDTHNYGSRQMIGDIPDIYNFTSGKPSYRLYVPLYFWFCRHDGLAIPLVNLQYSEVKIRVEFREAEECYIIGPTHSIQIDENIADFEPYEYIEQRVNDLVIPAIFFDYDILTQTLFYTKVSQDRTFDTEDKFLNPLTDQNEVNVLFGVSSNVFVHPVEGSTETDLNIQLQNTIALSSAFLLVDYAFLDRDEREKFAKTNHEYLIEQVQFTGDENVISNSVEVQVGFDHPVKELVWVVQLDYLADRFSNDIFNYTNNHVRNNDPIFDVPHYAGQRPIPIYRPLSETNVFLSNPFQGINFNLDQALVDPVLGGQNNVQRGVLLFNGYNRFGEQEGSYFSWLQVQQYHSYSADEGINVYSFALHPEQHQPSGAANMSRIDDIKLQLCVDDSINFCNQAKLRVYGVSYNVFRVVNGLGGLAFAN